MAKAGQTVDAVVVDVVEDRYAPDEYGVRKFFRGYTVIRCDWGSGPMDYNMVNGSVQGVPTSEQVKGQKGRVRWMASGYYHGPVWLRHV